MVLQAELYPHGGFQQQGYVQAQDYHSKNGYGHKEEFYSDNGYYESDSSMLLKPNVATLQQGKHYVVGHEDYAHQDSRYGKQQSYVDPYSKPHGFSGHESHGYPKPSNGMHHSAPNVGYESHHGPYTHTGPSSYGYYEEGRNRCPQYYPQQHKANKNWAAAGAEWVSRGI